MAKNSIEKRSGLGVTEKKKVEERKGHYYCLDEEGVRIPGTESDTPEEAAKKGAEILRKGK